jgi:hypothetical protein
MNDEERMKVLQMVSNAILSHEDGEKLLDALEGVNSEEIEKSSGEPIAAGKKENWLRYLVTDENSGQEEVNLRLPAKLIPQRLMRLWSKTENSNNSSDIEVGKTNGLSSENIFLNILGEKDGKRYQLYFE